MAERRPLVGQCANIRQKLLKSIIEMRYLRFAIRVPSAIDFADKTQDFCFGNLRGISALIDLLTRKPAIRDSCNQLRKPRLTPLFHGLEVRPNIIA